MADKKLNEVTKVTDMAYVPVIMADGSIGQIAKADLASVVEGLIGLKFYNINITVKAGEQNKSLGISGSSGILYVYNNKSGHTALYLISSFKIVDAAFIKSSASSGNLFSISLEDSGKIGINRLGINEEIVVCNNTDEDKSVSGFFLRRS